ncbi:hypothetical protein MKW94_027452 [Papaver nudicaule]|uniref:Eukaryotic translation initiation factor 2 subunit beta n=1 Tax=Papaver nudicaule TaxID=74823 RepID=A0AA42B2U6_PAPNU|nr:hypothetical protein [Papaver nudicaule]
MEKLLKLKKLLLILNLAPLYLPPCRGCCCGPDCCYPLQGTEAATYEYEELLARLYNMLTDNNPVLASGERRTTVLRTPQLLREGTRKTVLVNFMEICQLMHREPEHVMSFYLAEMGTSGSLDGTQMLVVRGRFDPKNFEPIQPRYVNEYVMCQGCKGADTVLFKENRLIFLRCEDCGSTRSVAPVKAGFVPRVGRRNRSWFRKT